MLSPNGQNQYQRLTASGQVKKGAGLITGFIVASGSPTIKLTNDLTGAGSDIILNTMQTAAATPYPISALFTQGCYATLTGAGDVTFLYQ